MKVNSGIFCGTLKQRWTLWDWIELNWIEQRNWMSHDFIELRPVQWATTKGNNKVNPFIRFATDDLLDATLWLSFQMVNVIPFNGCSLELSTPNHLPN